MLSAWAIVIGLAMFGFALLMIEIFVIPGFGVAGLSGIVAILGSVYYATVFEEMGPFYGAAIFAVMFTTSWMVVLKAARGGLWDKLRNRGKSPGRIGEDTGDDADRAASAKPEIGAQGVAVTMLRPAGIVRIGDRRYDVTVDGPVVDAGTAVEVTEIEGNLIKVVAI